VHRFRVVSLAALLLVAVSAPASAAPHAGDVAPAFSLPKTSGGNLTLSSLHGKPVYLNFFASWCSPCNAEAPGVADLAKKYAARGLKVVGVNEQEDKGKAAAFARQYKWPFAVTVDDGAMGKDYGVIALPVHVFIDRNGKISTYRLGEMEPDEIADAIKKII
jgi:peroxiredoxin